MAASDAKQVTIESGDTLSDAVAIGQSEVFALEIPIITAAPLYIQASMDNETFRRVLKADGSGDWNIGSSVGDRMIFLDEVAPFRFVKVESGSAQDADRLFTFWAKSDV